MQLTLDEIAQLVGAQALELAALRKKIAELEAELAKERESAT